MRVFSLLRDRFRCWRRRRASKRNRPALREFIYLDEVSVYSLIASRLGPIATQFTETERATLQGEAGSSISSSVPGVAKAEVRARAVTIRSQETQVLKKSIVQTTFKKLHDLSPTRWHSGHRTMDDRCRPLVLSTLSQRLESHWLRTDGLSIQRPSAGGSCWTLTLSSKRRSCFG